MRTFPVHESGSYRMRQAQLVHPRIDARISCAKKSGSYRWRTRHILLVQETPQKSSMSYLIEQRQRQQQQQHNDDNQQQDGNSSKEGKEDQGSS